MHLQSVPLVPTDESAATKALVLLEDAHVSRDTGAQLARHELQVNLTKTFCDVAETRGLFTCGIKSGPRP